MVEDFIALLQAITNGYLGDNIVFHLLLEVGTPKWHTECENSKITGKSTFKAIGLDLVKKQQEQDDRVYTGNIQQVPDKWQECFDFWQ